MDKIEDLENNNTGNEFNQSSDRQQEQQHQESGRPTEYPTGFFRFLQVQYWRKYFDFPQHVILERLQSSLIHFPVFTDMVHEEPDLYGPFWIYTTIVLFIGIAGNLHGYIDAMMSDDETQKYSFNYGFIPYASMLIYGIGVGLPALLYLFMKIFNSPVKFYSTLCLYGYSLSCFMIITPICSISYSVIHWILLIIGGVSSTVFMIKNIARNIDGLSQSQKYGIYGLICGFQLILVLFYKYYFFDIVRA